MKKRTNEHKDAAIIEYVVVGLHSEQTKQSLRVVTRARRRVVGFNRRRVESYRNERIVMLCTNIEKNHAKRN